MAAVFMFLALAMFGATASGETLRAGAAFRVITPRKPVYLAGLKPNRLSDGVHDELFARALVLQQDGEVLILVGVDLIGYPRSYVQEVKKSLAERGVPSENLIVCSTHQHSGPDTIGIWGPSPNEPGVDGEYMTFLAEQIADAATEAYQSRREAKAFFSAKKIPEGVARNVRIPDYHDDELRVLQFVGSDNKTTATLVNFTAHPETLWSDNTKLTADYPQHVYRLVEEAFGGTALFINGALGGMVTVDEKERTFAEAERIGTAVAETAIKTAHAAKPVENPTLRVRRQVFSTVLENETFRLGVQTGVIPIPLSLEGSSFETEVNLIRLGSVAIATVPGELLPKLGFRIREAMQEKLGVESPFLFGLANDELGYILAEEDFDLPLYQYEKSMSVGRKIGTEVVQHLVGLMEK